MDYDPEFVAGIQNISLFGLASESMAEMEACLALIESSCRSGHLTWTEEEELKYSSHPDYIGRRYRQNEPPYEEIVVERVVPVEGDPGTVRIRFKYLGTAKRGDELFRNFHRAFTELPSNLP